MANDSIPLRAVYAIRSTDGRSYVGASESTKRRFQWHRASLNRGRHHSRLLQESWRLLGAEAFSFLVLEAVGPDDDLIEREQCWMNQTGAASTGYNVAPVAGGSNRGIVRTAQVRAKVSAAHIGVQAGTKNPGARLTEDDVRDIRRRLLAGESQRAVAEGYKIVRSQIGKIALRKAWAHLP